VNILSGSPMNILVIDCETTGKDRPRQIVELCLQRGLGEGAPQWVRRFHPKYCPITPEAQQVHGISMEDVARAPEFHALALEISEWFLWADVIVGYNVEFDLQALQEEFARCLQVGLRNINLTHDKPIVDAYRLWQVMEPRSLAKAHERFAGKKLEGAHDASVDVAATGRVLIGMLERFGLLDRPWTELAELCAPKREPSWIGPSHHLQWKDGKVVFGFGKYKGQDVTEVRSSYVEWCLAGGFPDHVVKILKASLRHSSSGFVAWCRENYRSSDRGA
jgi:DNA polymerase-3 subunit epsilon